MLLVLLSWCYIFFTVFNLGVVFDKIARLQSRDAMLLPFLGLFFVTIFASLWAIFGRINIEFQIVLFLFHGIVGLRYKSDIVTSYIQLFTQLKALPKSLKVFILFLTLILLWQSASSIFFTDNETYYIQTIKWLNEYGFVNGLGNLNIFLGQTSGWHILQSAFSFSFLYKNFNDGNALCLLMVNVFALIKLNDYFENKTQLALLFGLLPFANLLLFQFSGVPSPDLAVYFIAFMVFYYFIDCFQKPTVANFQLVFILSVFVLYIKITALPLLLLPILLYVLNFKSIAKQIGLSYGIAFLVLGLLVVKNCILTGYPLFPISNLKDSFAFKATLPIELYDFWFNKAKRYDFVVLKSEFYHWSNAKIFIKWLFYSKIDSLFNSVLVLLLFVIPFFLKRFYNTLSYWIVYVLMIGQLVFLFFSSPQYRFALHFAIFFLMLLLSCFLKNQKKIIVLLYASATPILILLIFPFNQSSTTYAAIPNQPRFSIENCIFPTQNSALSTQFKQAQIGNLKYNSPDSNSSIWTTGNGDLPCVNTKQLYFFKNKYGFYPQQKSKNLQEGFYTKKTVR